jgi:hypothetical protein
MNALGARSRARADSSATDRLAMTKADIERKYHQDAPQQQQDMRSVAGQQGSVPFYFVSLHYKSLAAGGDTLAFVALFDCD